MEPRNHHYVPQHFLSAWSVDDGKKTNRYRRIAHTGKVEFRKGVSIVHCASENELYVLSDGINTVNFESSVMNESLDAPGAVVIKKLRTSGLDSLDEKDRFTLANYVICMEARNPKTMDKMQGLESNLGGIPDHNFAPWLDCLKNISAKGKRGTGPLGTTLYVKLDSQFGDDGFTNALLRCFPLEVKLAERRLVTSDYPVGRIGSYEEKFILSLAVAPDHAILWLLDCEMRTLISKFPEKKKVQIVNFLTLGDANTAFTTTDEPDSFVSKELGWKNRLDHEGRQKRLSEVLTAG